MGSSYPHPPMSAGPYRSTFNLSDGPNQEALSPTKMAYSPSRGFHHHHQRSQSQYGYPSNRAPPSPLNPSSTYNGGSSSPSSSPRSPLGFQSTRSPYLHSPPTSSTAIDRDANGLGTSPPTNGSAAMNRDTDSGGHRRHGRIHSRNLSVFFPRPGATGSMNAATPIEEDGTQEIEYSAEGQEIILSSDSGQGSDLGAGFKFGVQNPTPLPPLSPRVGNEMGNPMTKPKRRGHHHKHSLSHNFFSFMQPTSSHQQNGSSQLQSTDTSSSPWKGVPESSSYSRNALPTPTTTSFPSSAQLQYLETVPGTNGPTIARKNSATNLLGSSSPNSGVLKAKIFSILEFGVGAWLWAEGQRRGILSCTGLGYWVVFDAVGVWLGGVVSKWVKTEKRSLSRSYGARRIETVALFAQAIYLIFASVYVCKEAVEHLLLATGSGIDPGDSHHGHSSGESESLLEGLVYPSTVLWISLCSLLSSSLLFSNHSRILEATGSHVSLLGPLAQVFPSLRQSLPSFGSRLLTNPFSLAPLAFGLAIIAFDLFLDPMQHHSADVVLASIETVLTFYIAYPAAVALGKVLLQTAPERGLPGGQMEAFLRLMRELEHHPQIIHLPAPHLWQLTPVPPNKSVTSSASNGKSDSPYRTSSNLDDDEDMINEEGTLVATVQIHVKKDMDDADVLELTNYVRQRCTKALGVASAGVTVSYVKG
ncbi:hypothetical protein FRC03_007763 [Tulasnella sp. 419]|nr:hypothetical protein FRC03_007763 [Tulasnella sp. 419]